MLMKKVVIIGGGFAGSTVARKLEKGFDVTLIDTKDYFEFTPSVLRTIVEPEHIKKIQVLHSHYLHKAHIVKDDVMDVSDKKVKTLTGKSFEYDYLVIASGSSYNTPIKEKDLVIAARATELRNYAQKLKKAEKVLVIGGGVVGVELAAEIIEKYPNKRVTLVHSRDELLGRSPKKARDYALNFLKDKIEIVFNEKVKGNKGKIYSTNSGKEIEADLAFLCTGITPNFEHLEGVCSGQLDDKKYICVNPFLQVVGHRDVFSAGDITNIKEEKLAQSAQKQAIVVVENIKALEEGKDLEKYVVKKKVMIISLGKNDGMLIFGKNVFTGFLVGLLKSFVEWKSMIKYRWR